jgi:beta-barrel assembly-enhancing protease
MQPVTFFNGKIANGNLVFVEITNSGTICLVDTDPTVNNNLYFEVKNCTTNIIDNNLFVYLNTQSTQYIEVSKQNEMYSQLILEINKQTKPSLYDKLVGKKLGLLLGFLVALVVGCYFLFVNVLPNMAASLISIDQEKTLGDKMFASFIDSEKIDSSSTIQIQKFANSLNLSSKYKFTVTVLKNKEINAFAMPGGNIVVYSGIINSMKSYDELVALLGHESTHITQRHTLKHLLSGIGANIGLLIFTGNSNGLTTGVLSNANQLRSLHFSRGLETEADNKGMQKMIDNNIDPVGMKKLMKTLQGENKDKEPLMLKFISTHPLTKERIKNANYFIEKHKNNIYTVNQSLDSIFQNIKDKYSY